MISWRDLPGPWAGEPGDDAFEHRGFRCVARRNRGIGSWCGYVLVSPAQREVLRCPEDYDVHGGVTWCQQTDALDGTAVAIGFNCAHWGDLIPRTMRDEWMLAAFGFGRSPWSTVAKYRDLDFVREQCRALADQIADELVGELVDDAEMHGTDVDE